MILDVQQMKKTINFSLYDLLTLLYLYDVNIKKVNGIKLTEKDKKELNK